MSAFGPSWPSASLLERNVNVLLQFHVEADTRAIERWLVGHACELGQAGIDPRTLCADAKAVQ